MYLVLLILAILPGSLIAFWIYRQDKHAPEPHRRLALCFFYGVLTTIAAGTLEVLGKNLLLGLHSNIFHFSKLSFLLIYSIMVISLIEELVKFLVLRYHIYPKEDFDEPIDGIVYAVMIGMGFATAENILYVFSTKNIDHAMYIALLRMFTAVPAHASFAILMGYFVGMAKFANYTQRFSLKLKGLLSAILAHGLYDFYLFYGNSSPDTLWLSYLAFVVLLIAVILSMIMISKRKKEVLTKQDFRSSVDKNVNKPDILDYM
ncbi:MAG: PrsW family intramembrane metalloprotease [Saprospiraceae bacterium]|nr:PrsW family intramembrane metalloprotease [Saprospiraceae bacterium]